MSQILDAVFDGTVLHLETPLNLKAGTRVRVTVEIAPSEKSTLPLSFLQTAKSLQLDGSPDWSANLDHDLYHQYIPEND